MREDHKWSSYYSSITIDVEDEKSPPSLIGLLAHKMREMELSLKEGVEHRFVFKRPYRRYRRGRDRCYTCGYHLSDKEHQQYFGGIS